jgi:hypothetical protein
MASGANHLPPGEVEQIGDAQIFHDEESAVERLRQGGESVNGQGEPERFAEPHRGNEGYDIAPAARDDARD